MKQWYYQDTRLPLDDLANSRERQSLYVTQFEDFRFRSFYFGAFLMTRFISFWLDGREEEEE